MCFACYNFYMLVFDTICALSTAPYSSAIAVVRLSGDKTKNILSKIIKKNIDDIKANNTYFAKLYKDKNDDSSFIDEAIIAFFEGPRSYTGFDLCEFSVHGSMYVVDELLEALVKYGARRADKGEFSAQAYFNGKMDLLKAEGINDLINSRSRRAKEIATKTLSGNNSKYLTEHKNHILSILADLEYFVENQYSEDDGIEYEETLSNVRLSLNDEMDSFYSQFKKTRRNNKEYRGFSVCIAGEPNVGKSTLLNAIIGEDKAIVSPIPGTTRDVVEGEKEIKGITFRFKDTAGIRKTDDMLENLGIDRTRKMIENSDIILWASDTGFDLSDVDEDIKRLLEKKKTIKIATKSDVGTIEEGADIVFSSLKDPVIKIIDLIFTRLDIGEKEESMFLGKREEEYLFKIYTEIKDALSVLDDTQQIDITSDTLRSAISSINEMLGKDVNATMEDIYQTLFSKFCLGK